MNKRLFLLLLTLVPALSLASEGEIHLDKANIDPDNQQSLQRGARLFVNYCLSCHSAGLMRYERMGNDLGIPAPLVAENLMFTGGKIGDLMTVAADPADSVEWFGTAPPDLSVIVRARGVDWLYTYLRSFYLDPSRPTGVNNVVFPKVGMPDVLWELQGWQKEVTTTVKEPDGTEVEEVKLELVQPGTMSPEEFDRSVRDLVNFMSYMSEPAKHERQALGVKVILFLLVFLVVAYLMKKEFWKDVH